MFCADELGPLGLKLLLQRLEIPRAFVGTDNRLLNIDDTDLNAPGGSRGWGGAGKGSRGCGGFRSGRGLRKARDGEDYGEHDCAYERALHALV